MIKIIKFFIKNGFKKMNKFIQPFMMDKLINKQKIYKILKMFYKFSINKNNELI